MILILLGPPGVGKGTQAKKLEEKFDLVHVSTGDIFRNNIKNETDLGKEVKEIISKGKLVPDELTNRIVFERLSKEDCKHGFLLDGYPRSLGQAGAFDEWLKEKGLEITKVIELKVEDEEIISRISGRRVCPNCGSSYHMIVQPPKVDGICDKCGTDVVQRPDDNEETVKKRIEIYKEQTSPVKDYYAKQGKHQEFKGTGSIDQVFEDIVSSLK